MKKIFSILVIIFLIHNLSFAQSENDDRARIFKAMDKGRNGEDLKIGVIGGSITQGYAASSDSKRWSNLMADWWESKFTDSKIELINAGWGGTGSDIGVHRVYDDLLVHKPDFIVIEFAVNDTEGDLATKMMEGLVQQILQAENSPGVMILMLKQDNGTTAQASHKLVGEHYKVPMVSFADLIDAQVASDDVTLSSIFVDGLHPNDAGMAYIAGFISNHLDTIYSKLPATENLPKIETSLPAPLISDTFAKTYQFFPKNIIPLANNGWNITETGWSAETPGQQIDFQITGNAVSLIFTQNNNNNRGKAEIWVDNGEKAIINAYMTDDWGTKSTFSLIKEGLSDGEHTLHIKVIDETSTGGKYVHIARVLVAGNVGSAAPIAVTSKTDKTIAGREISLNGSESFDPDGEAIEEFLWTIEEKPAGSAAVISSASESIAKFTPDMAGTYTLNLVVSSGINSSVPAVKKIEVRASNTIPVAVPGNDTISALNKYFRFDRTKSYDADGDELTYNWVLESAPEGSETIVMLADSEKPQCKFDIEGSYIFSLVVSDGFDLSEKQEIKVIGKEGYTSINQGSFEKQNLKIYPNPSNDEVNVQYSVNKIEPITIEVYSFDGTKVGNVIHIPTVIGINTHSFSIKEMTSKPGIYFIKVSAQSKSVSSIITLI